MKIYVSATALRASLIGAMMLCGASTTLDAQTLPSPWAQAGVGAPRLSGSASESAGVFTLTAAGTDISGSSDQFHFLYQAVSGDVELKARLDSFDQSSAFANAGVMIRSSLAVDAAHGYGMATVGRGLYFRYRPTNGASTIAAAGPRSAAPVWLRVVRRGSVVTSYSSSDGATWTSMGSADVALGATTYVGLALTSRKATARATAVFSSVTITPLATGALPSGQQSSDIGSPALAGRASHASGVYTIVGAGADIWGTADQFHYVYQPLTGDAELTARVTSLAVTHDWAKAGLMIRESLTAASRYALAATSGTEGWAFQSRAETGAASVHTAGAAGTTPAWLRLVRAGDFFTAYRSTDGIAWTAMGSEVIPMGTTVYAGLAVTSHNPAVATTALIDRFTVTSLTSANQPPAVSIVDPANGTLCSPTTAVTISATAADPENRMLSVDFYVGSTLIARDTSAPFSATWLPSATGPHALTAVAHDADGGSSTSSAVTVTVQGPNQSPAVSLSTGGSSFTAPATIALTASASDPENQLARVEFFNGATRLATDTTAPYGFSWASVPAGVYSLTAVAFDAAGASATSAAVSVTVQAAANQPPTVSLSAGGSSFTAPATIALTATASDPEGQLARVEFFNGSARLATDTTAPYAFSWSNVPAGIYSLTAVAFDATGASASSAALSVTVQAAPNQPPTVSLSTGGLSFTAPATMALTAVASDPEGQLARVEFFNGPTRLATDTTAPYAFSWANVAAGVYSITAVAFDTAGASASSAVVTVTVVAVVPPPTGVVFTASPDHDTSVTGYVLKIYAAGANPATATALATSDLGKPAPANGEIAVDRSSFFSALPVGNYVATVTAVGPGGQTQSTSTAFSR